MGTPEALLGELYLAFTARHGKKYADSVFYSYQIRGGFYYIQLPDVVNGKIYPAPGTFPRPYRRKEIVQMITYLQNKKEG